MLWWQECMRAVVIFIYGLILVRIAGRRVFGRWSALDIIVAIIIGSNLSRALTGPVPLGGTLAATTLMMALHWVLAQIAARSPVFAGIVEGKPRLLARGGRLQRSELLRDAISQHDLEEALHQSGVEHVEETRLVVLQPSGKITVLKGRQAA
ncbi:DUF421 domain-containing protein [Rhodopila globiformis]|uniref:DUF421 domain-containing protein n=2 Tax=Rhodopila globiformis TaxID=1071 RepID=A0A2S6NKX6_RHOGL|nr:DUF421 domain-containing protein [Rhodopila globiformis]